MRAIYSVFDFYFLLSTFCSPKRPATQFFAARQTGKTGESVFDDLPMLGSQNVESG